MGVVMSDLVRLTANRALELVDTPLKFFWDDSVHIERC